MTDQADVFKGDFRSVTEREAREIAAKIDPRAGGFFASALTKAVLEGAKLQREKDKR